MAGCNKKPLQCLTCGSYVPRTGIVEKNIFCTLCSSLSQDLTGCPLLPSLPCRFKNFGCQEEIPFGHNHETDCDYQPFPCPWIPSGICSWRGPAIKIPTHFLKEHFNFVYNKAEFTIGVDQDNDGVFLVMSGALHVIIKYTYKSEMGTLWYNIRSLIKGESRYKIRLINNQDEDFSCTLKGGLCRFYDNDFTELGTSPKIILNNYQEILNKPNFLTVRIEVCLKDSSSIRCSECLNYFTPPIYATQNGIVCLNCEKETEPTSRLIKVRFLCRWNGCKIAGRGIDMEKHEETCQHKTFKCLERFCDVNLKVDETFSHLQTHGYVYFTETWVYKLNLDDSNTANVFTIKNGKTIAIRFQTKIRENGKYGFKLSVNVSDNRLIKLSFGIKITHNHCKVDWKRYFLIFPKSKYIQTKDLPDCFKINEDVVFKFKCLNVFNVKNSYK